MSYNAINTSEFPVANDQLAGSEYSDNESRVVPNAYAADKASRTPVTRERDVTLSVGQSQGKIPPRRESYSSNNGNDVYRYNAPIAPGARPRSSTPLHHAHSPSVADPAADRRGSRNENGKYRNLDGSYRASNAIAPSYRSAGRRSSSISANVSRGGGGRGSYIRTSRSVSRARARPESPKPPFVVDLDDGAGKQQRDKSPQSKKAEGRKKVDAKEVDAMWRGELRGDDLEKEAGSDDGDAYSPRDRKLPRAHSMGSVYVMQQNRRNSVQYPQPPIDREVPYDYIRVAKHERGKRPDDGKPPTVYAVHKLKRAGKNKAKNEESVKVDQQQQQPQEQQQVVYDIVDESPATQERSPGQSPQRWQPVSEKHLGNSLNEDTYEYAAPENAEEEDANDQSTSQVSQSTAEARRTAYQQWRDRTANGLYKDVFVPPRECERAEVPPLFEPALTDAEKDMLAEADDLDDAAMHAYEEKILRYRLATQHNVKKTSVEDVQLAAADAATMVPIVRAVRYHHEECNWQEALATIARNKENIEQSKAEEAEAEANYQAALVSYQEALANYQRALAQQLQNANSNRGLGASPDDETTIRSVQTLLSYRDPSMSNAGINSATTPGWMRHREFSVNEWDELRGKRSSLVGSARGGAEDAGPRNPNQPAWMHHLNAAQAAEEANDPQQQKLNEIEQASSIGRQRRSVGPSFSIAQSHRMRANGGDMASEESLSFARSTDEGGSSAQYSIARPTRVDVAASRPEVVDNAITREEIEVVEKVKSKAPPPPPPPMQEVMVVVPRDPPQPPLPPEAREPVVLERVTFRLFAFSTFEAAQQLKRMTWWCAARNVGAFTVRAGEVDGYKGDSGGIRRGRPAGPPQQKHQRQPRSYSPTFFPGIARFYEETLATVTNDLWLRKRVTVAAHDNDSGEVDLEVNVATLSEAAQQNWLMLPKDGDEVHNKELYPRSDGTVPQQQPPEMLSTARPQDPHGSTLPPLDPNATNMNSSIAGVLEPQMEELHFFTATPHPNGAKPRDD